MDATSGAHGAPEPHAQDGPIAPNRAPTPIRLERAADGLITSCRHAVVVKPVAILLERAAVLLVGGVALFTAWSILNSADDDQARPVRELQRRGIVVTLEPIPTLSSIERREPYIVYLGFPIDGGSEHDVLLAREARTIRAVSFAGSAVSDSWLRHLSGLEYLEWINLTSTEVTDAGLDSITRLPHLRAVHLYGTRVSEAGVQRFRQRFPGVYVAADLPLAAVHAR